MIILSKLSEKLKNGITILQGPAVLELLIKTGKIWFWLSITQELLGLLKVECHFWVSQTICFGMLVNISLSKICWSFWDSAQNMLNFCLGVLVAPNSMYNSLILKCGTRKDWICPKISQFQQIHYFSDKILEKYFGPELWENQLATRQECVRQVWTRWTLTSVAINYWPCFSCTAYMAKNKM